MPKKEKESLKEVMYTIGCFLETQEESAVAMSMCPEVLASAFLYIKEHPQDTVKNALTHGLVEWDLI